MQVPKISIHSKVREGKSDDLNPIHLLDKKILLEQTNFIG